MEKPGRSVEQTSAPERAPVVPRARMRPDGEVLPIEDLVRPFVERKAVGEIAIVGVPGSGKSVALRHLAFAFAEMGYVVCLDDDPLVGSLIKSHLVLRATTRSYNHAALAVLELAPWGDDEAIEYLLVRHREQCASVMKRMRADEERISVLRGLPLLWRLVLDEMAGDDAIADAASAIRRGVERVVPDLDAWNSLAAQVWSDLREAPASQEREIDVEARMESHGVEKLLRHRPVRVLLAVDCIVRTLVSALDSTDLEIRWCPPDLIHSAAIRLAAHPLGVAKLEEAAIGVCPAAQPLVVSLLVACKPEWRPSGPAPRDLAGAYLVGVRWSRLDLRQSILTRANLKNADLSEANLAGRSLDGLWLEGACLRGAEMSQTIWRDCDMDGADMREARMDGAYLLRASLNRAHLENAYLAGSKLFQSRTTGARFCGANLRSAEFFRVAIAGADFSGADLTEARLDGVDFREVRLDGATLARAMLRGCDFEYVEIESPDFRGANLGESYLTGSKMTRANFRQASLRRTGLSDIHWEHADLRDADLTEASFHLGSSRSGLVGSVIASEGSRTGFYTDEYLEQDFKSPEEIRKANLRGADLRGAKVLDADFYLVDLREARYTPDQAEHFARCRAILHDRGR